MCTWREGLYINYQLDALIIIYSQNTILLYMFRASSAHLQEDTVVYMKHMVLSLCKQVSGRVLLKHDLLETCRGEYIIQMSPT